jgi:hypothetical protein
MLHFSIRLPAEAIRSFVWGSRKEHSHVLTLFAYKCIAGEDRHSFDTNILKTFLSMGTVINCNCICCHFTTHKNCLMSQMHELNIQVPDSKIYLRLKYLKRKCFVSKSD